MDSKDLVLDFTNHENKCRLCLRDFEIDDTQIKITSIVEIRFYELTSINVRLLTFGDLCKS